MRSNKHPKAVVSKDAELNTYAHLHHASWAFRKQSENQIAGSYYQQMAGLIFAAFTIEAFCNHVGDHLFADWVQTERKLSPKDKLKRICTRLQIAGDFGKRPYSTIGRVLNFRNDLAHGRSVKLKKEFIVTMDEQYELFLQQQLQANWQKFITAKNLRLVHEDLKQIIETIHAKSKMDDQVFNLGLWGYRAVPKAEADPNHNSPSLADR